MQFRCNGLHNEFLLMQSAVKISPDGARGYGDDVHISATTNCYLGLWTILNTRGIEKRVDEPDAKLNAARARNGKPPLQRVTRINGAQYITALRETARMEREGRAPGGERRSPKMHLRRGHLRKYEGERWKTKKAKWIRPMIIAGTGEIDRNRDGYRIEKQ